MTNIFQKTLQTTFVPILRILIWQIIMVRLPDRQKKTLAWFYSRIS